MSNSRNIAAIIVCLAAIVQAGTDFVNWEDPHVSPLAITPDGLTLLAVNTPDNRLEVFDISSATAVPIADVPVGLDPVSVRARTNDEVWVVNHISDTVSIVSLTTLNVIATLQTADEPADVVFAGSPQRAFVSCSQENIVQVFDPANLDAAPTDVAINGEDPRAMTVSADGLAVYVAIFESGNGTTILGGGSTMSQGFPPNVVSDPLGPYGGQNPPPNNGVLFEPPMNPSLPDPIHVGLIVREDDAGQWMDDNNGNWTNLVSGPLANRSGRPVGWELPDRDLAIIDTTTLGVAYVHRLMNINMAIGTHPDGRVTVVGTEATNEIRFEPNLNGTFVRVHAALVNPTTGDADIVDLNDHLDYTTSLIAQSERDKSIGDPRGIVWNSAGNKGYITGMGSNNVIIIEADGNRAGLAPTIDVGEGPTGIVIDEARSRVYVLNKFESSISVINTTTEAETARVSFHDPSPAAIKEGRKHLYDTHENSGLGQVACASCHVDARMDRLAWDLGDPSGDMKVFNQNCNAGIALLGVCRDWHPMKGPMTTQTMQDIIGKEPHHWRGDRNGLEEFNGAFEGLLGDDIMLSSQEMQEFEDFLATIHFPPNPFRNFDNTLPTNLPLPGQFTPGEFGPAGLPLPNGNAVAGLNNYRTGNLDGGLQCVTCHSLPTGIGTNLRLMGLSFQPFPTGPDGELHHMIVAQDGSTNISIKVPQLRNMYDKVGFELTQSSNNAGFGFLHDGSVDSLARFVTEPVFDLANVQEVADMVAFMMAFAGSDLPIGSPTNPVELPGPAARDTHAAVGTQITINGEEGGSIALDLIDDMLALADSAAVGVVVKGVQDDIQRGYAYLGAGNFQSDREEESISAAALSASATTDNELTYTVVPFGSEIRIGIDRDRDGYYDQDERDAGSDPADPESTPDTVAADGDFDNDGDVDLVDFGQFQLCYTGAGAGPVSAPCDLADFDDDGDVDLVDFGQFQLAFTGPL